MTKKSSYPKLTKLVCNKLKEDFKDKKGINEYSLDKEKGLISFKADFSVELNPKKLLFIEIEETQAHPNTNISKYWMFLDKNKDIRIILIQIFGRGFSETKNNYRSRLDLCKFIADKMNIDLGDRFCYFSKELDKKIGEYMNNAEGIAEEIVNYINNCIRK